MKRTKTNSTQLLLSHEAMERTFSDIDNNSKVVERVKNQFISLQSDGPNQPEKIATGLELVTKDGKNLILPSEMLNLMKTCKREYNSAFKMWTQNIQQQGMSKLRFPSFYDMMMKKAKLSKLAAARVQSTATSSSDEESSATAHYQLNPSAFSTGTLTGNEKIEAIKQNLKDGVKSFFSKDIFFALESFNTATENFGVRELSQDLYQKQPQVYDCLLDCHLCSAMCLNDLQEPGRANELLGICSLLEGKEVPNEVRLLYSRVYFLTAHKILQDGEASAEAQNKSQIVYAAALSQLRLLQKNLQASCLRPRSSSGNRQLRLRSSIPRRDFGQAQVRPQAREETRSLGNNYKIPENLNQQLARIPTHTNNDISMQVVEQHAPSRINRLYQNSKAMFVALIRKAGTLAPKVLLTLMAAVFFFFYMSVKAPSKINVTAFQTLIKRIMSSR